MLTARRVYLYVMALIGLGVLAAGLQGILRVLLRNIGLPDGPSWAGQVTIAEQLSLSGALILVGLPIWLIHWVIAERGVQAGRDGSGERCAPVRALYLSVVLAVSAGFVAAMTSGLLRYGLTQATGTVGEYPDVAPAGDLAALVVAGVARVYHARIRRRDLAAEALAGAAARLPRLYL